MKIFSRLAMAGALAFAVSCEKPQSEADRQAQIEKEVQARVAAERQADEQQRLAQQSAELEAREKALSAKEQAGAALSTPRVTPRTATSSSTASSSRSPSGYETFYRKLEPHGAWRETDSYGYVWQPRAAQQSRNWRPYTDGRWAYTDAGWTWISDEAFGWATYHYGRWTRLRGVGWVWVPGDEWAPAWVSWRKSDQYVGWAPLPPEARFERRTGIKKWADSYYDIDAGEYVFIPNEEIGAENIGRAVVPPERSITIVTQTTNVTNITYNNNVIVNEGPNYDELRGRSRRPLERMRIERQYDVEEQTEARPVVRGDVISLVAPLFTARATEAPRTSAPRIERAATERISAEGIDPAELERAREKMRAEATAPPDAPSKRYEKPEVSESTPAPASTVATTAAPVATPRPTVVATATPTSAPQATAAPTATITPTPRATATATPTPRPTATPAPTPTPTATPRATATPTATAAEETAPPDAATSPSGRDARKAEQERRREERARQMLGVPPASPSPAAESSVPPLAAPRASAPRLTPTPRAAVPSSADPEDGVKPLHEPTPSLKKELTAPDSATATTPSNRAKRALEPGPAKVLPTPAPTPSPTPVG